MKKQPHSNIHLFIERDYDAMSQKAAEIFMETAGDKPDGVFGFATGSTPEGLYQCLARLHQEKKADLSRMTTFNLDEYYPIRRDDPQSYYYFMHKHLFNPIQLKESQIHLPNGEAPDPLAECDAYEKCIADAGGIDLQVLGIGANGHIGFNEPAESFSPQTTYLPLTEVTIQSNARFFENANEVPRHALTMGIRSIMMARKILFLCNGATKAGIFRDAFFGPITPLVPASVLQLHREVYVVVDELAASMI